MIAIMEEITPKTANASAPDIVDVERTESEVGGRDGWLGLGKTRGAGRSSSSQGYRI